jgi:hypothetical protein
VPGYNALNNGKADTGTFKFIRGMEMLEYPEQIIRTTGIIPNAVVPDAEDHLPIVVLCLYLDFRILYP